MIPEKLSDAEAAKIAEQNKREEAVAANWRDSWRGAEIGIGVYRNFCCRCHVPIVITDVRLRHCTDKTCDDCVRSSGNTIAAGAFSPDRKQSTR